MAPGRVWGRAGPALTVCSEFLPPTCSLVLSGSEHSPGHGSSCAPGEGGTPEQRCRISTWCSCPGNSGASWNSETQSHPGIQHPCLWGFPLRNGEAENVFVTRMSPGRKPPAHQWTMDEERWSILTVEYYSAMNRKEVPTHATGLVDTVPTRSATER